MGLIDDISLKIVPRTQELMDKKGLNMSDALLIAFNECGYISKKTIKKKNINIQERIDD